MGDNFSFLDPTTWWGDSSPVDTQPVEPTSDVFNQDYGNSSNTGVFPDGSGGYTDINGNAVDSTGQPIQYDSNGSQIDSNGNIVNKAGAYQPSSQDQTVGYDQNGNPVDANGNPIQQQNQQQQQRQYGQQQGGQQRQQGGVLSSLFGGGNNNQQGGDSSSGLLGTLGMLAAGAGAGYLLSNLLGNKASGGAGTVNPVNIPQGNLQFTQLANPGVNPGYAMGQPVAPATPTSSTLGQLIAPTAIPTINPVNQTLTR